MGYLANTISHNPKFSGDYTGVIVSRKDELRQGRLLIKVPELLGEEPIWAQSKQISGKFTIQAIPPEGQKVKVHFNGTETDCTWEGGYPETNTVDDADEVIIKDDQGNFVMWHRLTGEFHVNGKGPITLESKTKAVIKAPVIELDGVVTCSNGATGVATMLSQAVISKGVITGIQSTLDMQPQEVQDVIQRLRQLNDNIQMMSQSMQSVTNAAGLKIRDDMQKQMQEELQTVSNLIQEKLVPPLQMATSQLAQFKDALNVPAEINSCIDTDSHGKAIKDPYTYQYLKKIAQTFYAPAIASLSTLIGSYSEPLAKLTAELQRASTVTIPALSEDPVTVETPTPKVENPNLNKAKML